MYFVALCTIRSAPKSIGFWAIGEAKVLSTQNRILFSFAIFPIARRSEIFKVGFVGDSIQIKAVLSVIASATFLASVASTYFTLIPNFS
ncbi:hypothetical protein D9M69_616110 [compost metagenome]